MIGSVRGRLLFRGPSEVIVEAAGVGYSLAVPVSALADLPPEGAEVFLHVHTHLREDSIQLFGFLREEEKRIFNTLIGITGIGPRLALSIISSMPYEDFLRAVEAEDMGVITTVPGLGKKTAHRLVLELRGRLPKLGEPADRVFDDTLSALVNLGYRKADALAALEKAGKALRVSDGRGSREIEPLLKESLKYLTGAVDEKG